jgi:crossover junction endodeoxyribonuclease RusA
MPPTANKLFINIGRGRACSREYEKWKASVAAYALITPRFTLQGEVEAVYLMGKPSKRRMDLANREKGTSDALTAWGILKDDSQIVDMRLAWSDEVKPGYVRVMLRERD